MNKNQNLISESLNYRQCGVMYRLSWNLVYPRSQLFAPDPEPFLQHQWRTARATKVHEQEVAENLSWGSLPITYCSKCTNIPYNVPCVY